MYPRNFDVQNQGSYQVVFTGYEKRSMELQNALQKATGCSAQEASDALSNTPVILFNGVDEKTAKKCKQQITDAGGICEVKTMAISL